MTNFTKEDMESIDHLVELDESKKVWKCKTCKYSIDPYESLIHPSRMCCAPCERCGKPVESRRQIRFSFPDSDTKVPWDCWNCINQFDYKTLRGHVTIVFYVDMAYYVLSEIWEISNSPLMKLIDVNHIHEQHALFIPRTFDKHYLERKDIIEEFTRRFPKNK